MSKNDREALIQATAGLLNSVEGVVRASADLVKSTAAIAEESTPVTPAEDAMPGIRPVPSDLSRIDSPAWLNFHHPGGDDEIKRIGDAYHDAHFAGVTSSNGRQYEDPSVGATWKDFARIYARLFDRAEAFDRVSGNLMPDPFPGVQMLQRQIAIYDVNDPDKRIQKGFPWPSAGPVAPPEGTPVGEAISLYLSGFNLNPDGSPPDRLQDFPKNPPNPDPKPTLRLTHGQLVQLRHVFTTQEDLRLLSPYSAINMIW